MSEENVNSLSAEQCRAARALLGWSQRDLAKAASVAIGTIVDFERGLRRPYLRTLKDVREVLERAGVEFLNAADGKGVGVRLSRSKGEQR
jgi:transcriptional regulator with XRE-family HTH domain